MLCINPPPPPSPPTVCPSYVVSTRLASLSQRRVGCCIVLYLFAIDDPRVVHVYCRLPPHKEFSRSPPPRVAPSKFCWSFATFPFHLFFLASHACREVRMSAWGQLPSCKTKVASKRLHLNLNHYQFHGRGSCEIAGVVKRFDWRPGGQMNPGQPCGNQNRSATEPAPPVAAATLGSQKFVDPEICSGFLPTSKVWFSLNNKRSTT